MNNIIHFFLRILIVTITLAIFWSVGNSYAAEPMPFTPPPILTPGVVAASAPPAAIASTPTNVLTVRDAESTVGQELIKAGTAKEIKVHITGVSDDETVASAPQPLSAHVDGLSVDKERNRWEATLLLTSGGKNLAPVKLSGTYEEMTQLPVLKHNMGAGEVISQDDLDWSSEPSAHLRSNTVIDASDLLGKTPKHVISEGRPVRLDEIASPALINKGSHITLLYQTHNLVIRTLGEAIDSGAKGDVIRVRNLASKSIIDGTVQSGDSVRVTSPDSTSAEAM